jgi:putative hemolysin
MFAVRVLGVLALILLNGFFAAAEFSLVAVRMSRVKQLVAKGNLRARVVEILLGDLRQVVSGVQLGITLSSLAIGALGEASMARFFEHILPVMPGRNAVLMAHGLALTAAFALLSGLHVVIGELVPKTLSLARAERVALLIALPFNGFLKTFRWAIYLLEKISNAIIRALGVSAQQSHNVAHSTEELQIQIQQARERGLLAPGEEKFIVSAIELTQVEVREIMVPRPDMLWVLLDRERRTAENLPPPVFDLRRVLREVLIVPETKPASELLPELRARHVGMAMVVDEFGSILGLVTLEDILEQVVGEIHDEFDVVEQPLTLADGAVVFDAALNVRDLDTQYNITLPEDPAYATVGGFVLDQLGFIPKGGESFEYGTWRFTVVEMDGRRVARVKIQRIRAAADAAKADASVVAANPVKEN